jgi:hypothetical protein
MRDWIAAFAAVPDARCADIVDAWRPGEGEPSEGRDLLYRSLEDENSAAARQLAATEVAALLAFAQRAFGDLRGLLAGLPDDLLDRAPADAEWPLRATLHHIGLTEVTFRLNTLWALTRSEADPVRNPAAAGFDERLFNAEGGFDAVLDRIAAERETSDDELSGAGGDQLTRATVWAAYPVDVRFRLGRFASHVIEHTIQCEKTLVQLGIPLGEARLITRRISAARGAHERSSPAALLEQLDATHAERARALASG